jgi:hypothetical protein
MSSRLTIRWSRSPGSRSHPAVEGLSCRELVAASVHRRCPLQWDVSDELFAKYRDLIYREAGIALTDGKKSLLVSRVAAGCASSG